MNKEPTYNEEMMAMFYEYGIVDANLTPIKDEDKAEPEDFQELADRIQIKTKKNDDEVILSRVLSKGKKVF